MDILIALISNYYILLLVIAIILLIKDKIKKNKQKQHKVPTTIVAPEEPQKQEEPEPSEKIEEIDWLEEPEVLVDDLPIEGAYQQKWLLTYNEKDAYKILKQICDKNNLHLMTKVRLLDIVEPIRRQYKYKTYLYKIQAKHVDFVICDERLVARCIIELDDSSHYRDDRMERDRFVDRVLESVGYQVLRTRNVTEDIEAEILKAIPSAAK